MPSHAILLGLILAAGSPASPPLGEVLAASRDLWGEAAMREPNGASYEFLAPLLPPLRYVNADFRSYPLVLSAPGAKTKARLISNGSGLNLRGGSRSWRDVGVPFSFRVGPDEFPFGGRGDRVSEPKPADGYLPIHAIEYRHPFPVQSEGLVPINVRPAPRVPEVYRLEAFASTDPAHADSCVVFVKFSLAAGTNGVVSVVPDPSALARFAGGIVRDGSGNPILHLDSSWRWERGGARATLKPGTVATLAAVVKPLADPSFRLAAGDYDRFRRRAVDDWNALLDRGMKVEIPEPRVNHARRNLLIQNFMLAVGDRMNYSSGNQYEQLYSSEGGDAVLAMLAWGYEAESNRMFRPILAFTRKGLEGHQAGNKLIDVARYWFQTRDRSFVDETRPIWRKEMDLILRFRDLPNGLLPKERYCGDIATPVHSLAVQAKAWRGLNDMARVLRGIGDEPAAREAETAAAEFRAKILDAFRRSVRKETDPPFVPIALLADESIHDPITETRIGSYWNLIIGYVIWGRLFDAGSPEDSWIPRYLETRGGLCMGMIRAGGKSHGFWSGPSGVNPLYGTRYALDALRRDDPERALVSFYGMLAQGMTRDTFVSGEGADLEPLDERGRLLYCPPNTAGNAHFLNMLRALLVQDHDQDNDGAPDTLRLAFGTSRRWLEAGKTIDVKDAPTAFGRVSYRLASEIANGRVVASVRLPTRDPFRRALLRARVPEGFRVVGAEIDGRPVAVDATGAVELPARGGELRVLFRVEPAPIKPRG